MLVGTLLLAPSYLCAQAPFIKSYTVENGLPSSVGFHVIQDHKGYIWLATDRGVSRFNGKKFKNFSSKDSLSGNSIFLLNIGSDSSIWFNHFNQSLSYFKNNSIHPYQYHQVLHQWLGNSDLISMHFIEGEGLWLGINGYKSGKSCLALIDTNGVLHEVPEARQQVKLVVKKLSDGAIIHGIQMGEENEKKLSWLSGDGDYLLPLLFEIPSDRILSTFISKGNILFLCHFGVLYRIENGMVKKRLVGHKTNSLYVDRDGDLWLGLAKGGVLQLNAKDLEVKKLLFPQKVVTSIWNDHEGGYWFSTLEDGLLYSNNLHLQLFQEQDGLPSRGFTGLLQRNDTVFLGHSSGHVSLHRPTGILLSKKIEHYVSHISDLENGKILLYGTGHKISPFIFNTQTLPFALSSAFNPIQNTLWTGSTQGINIYQLPILERPTPLEGYHERTEALCFHNDTLWIGSINGLFIKVNGEIKPYHPVALCSEHIIAIEADANCLVVASKSKGILVKKMGKGKVYDATKHLQADFVNDVVLHHDSLWISTSSGISFLDLNSSKDSIQHFGVANGLPTPEINELTFTKEGIWFTSYLGLGFLPFRKFSSAKTPLVYITSVLAGAQSETSLQKHYNLPFGENYLEVSFESVAFQGGISEGFEYQFSPLINEWKDIQHGAIQFNSLAPGNYQFKVRSKDSKVSAAALQQVHFTVQKAFWHTLVFRVALTLVLLVLLFSVYRFNIGRITRRHHLEQELEKINNRVLRAQMNPHFIYNSLNSVQSFIVKNDLKNSMRYLAKFSKLMRKIFESSAEETVSLESELETLALYVSLEKQRRRKEIHLRVDFSKELDMPRTMIPPMLLQPLIENAILHGILKSPDSGYIRLAIEAKPKWLRFEISNNGVGITGKKAEELKRLVFLQPDDSKAITSGFLLTMQRVINFNKKYRNNEGLELQLGSANQPQLEWGSETTLSFNMARI